MVRVGDVAVDVRVTGDATGVGVAAVPVAVPVVGDAVAAVVTVPVPVPIPVPVDTPVPVDDTVVLVMVVRNDVMCMVVATGIDVGMCVSCGVTDVNASIESGLGSAGLDAYTQMFNTCCAHGACLSVPLCCICVRVCLLTNRSFLCPFPLHLRDSLFVHTYRCGDVPWFHTECCTCACNTYAWNNMHPYRACAVESLRSGSRARCARAMPHMWLCMLHTFLFHALTLSWRSMVFFIGCVVYRLRGDTGVTHRGDTDTESRGCIHMDNNNSAHATTTTTTTTIAHMHTHTAGRSIPVVAISVACGKVCS